MNIPNLSKRLCGVLAVLAAGAIPGYAQTACSGSAPGVTCMGAPAASWNSTTLNSWVPGTPYPSTFVVSGFGAAATVTGVSITLHGLNAAGVVGSGACLADAAFLLVGPNNKGFFFMNQAGYNMCNTTVNNGNGENLSNLTLNIGDANATAMPDSGTSWPANGTTASVTPGTGTAGGLTSTTGYPSAPASTFQPAPTGTATFASVFTGSGANGTWSLYLADYQPQAGDSLGFTSWDMTLTVSATAVETTTSLSSNTTSPAVTGNSITYTATVNATGTPIGTVNFTDTLPGGSAATISGCGSVVLSGGSATCTTSTSIEGNHLITANYSGSGSFDPSFGTMTETFRKATTNPAGTQFCNAGSIGIPGVPANQAIYPSYINVTGVTPTVANLSIQLNGFQAPNTPENVQMMLVSPSGQALEFLSQVGGGSAQSGVSITVADANPEMPENSTLIAGTYGGTSYTTGDVYPAPAPASFSISPPGGSAAIEQVFSGATSDGLWQLFVHDNGGTGSSASVSGGWCITLTPNTGVNTTTTVTATPNPTTTGTQVTFTATVKAGATPVTTGTVTFTENGSQVGGGTLNGSGTASFQTTSLIEGDHTITATYSGVTGSFNPGYGTVVERLNNVPTISGNNPYLYCNTGGIAIPASNTAPNDIGAGYPNPSILAVANLPGTISAVNLELNNYHAGVPNAVSTLLVGPAATNAQSFDLFSGAGGNTAPFGPGNITLSDTATSTLSPTGLFAAGTYKPASFDTGDTFTASPSTFYTLPPGPYNYAATAGTSTFSTLFNNLAGDGLWSLYFNQNTHEQSGGVTNGWCLSFTENAVTGAATLANTPTAFTQGQSGTITLSIENKGDASGKGSSGDPAGTNPLQVTGTLPTGLTFGAVPTGSPWNCTTPTSTTVSCTSSSTVAVNSTYTLLSLPVNVANNAPATASVSAFTYGPGGDMTPGSSNADSFTINPAPVLSISKAPGGTFTQGQTAIWNVTVSNVAANSMTSGTVTVIDTLPTGYTLSSYTGTGWTCGAVTVTVTCTSTTVVSGGNSYPAIALTVNVPANSPTSVTNNAGTYGGGDLTHSSGNPATTFSTVTVTQVPAAVNITAGNNQSAPINTAFTTNLSVTVLDGGGAAINGATVTFTAPASGPSGAFSGGTNVKTITTNSSGVATATVYTANGNAGGPYTIGAAAGTITSNFSETNLSGAASSMTANAGTTPQTATVGIAFPNALAVTVKDSGGNPVQGVSVTFTAPASGASGTFSNSASAITIATNTSGIASAMFTANSKAGSYNVTASATGLTSLNFSLTNLAGAAASITANAGTTPQTATVNTQFASPLAVTVSDAFGNPISGANVTFTAPASGVSGTFSNSASTIMVSTSSSGVASAAFTANGTAGGPYSVSATTGALSTSFSLTNASGVQVSPTVVSYSVLWGGESYNMIGSVRNRLPWQITGIQVVFSEPITTGNVNSLSGTGVTTTGFSGLGTNTLTWTINPLSLGNFPTTLAASGPNALKDSNGNSLGGGTAFNQNLKILYGDFNDDGLVNSQDSVGVNNASKAAYNIFADMNGDGIVNITDVRIVAAQAGTSLP